jgi:hypothetical protein
MQVLGGALGIVPWCDCLHARQLLRNITRPCGCVCWSQSRAHPRPSTPIVCAWIVEAPHCCAICRYGTISLVIQFNLNMPGGAHRNYASHCRVLRSSTRTKGKKVKNDQRSLCQ